MDHSNSAATIGANYRAAAQAQADSVRLLHACGIDLARVKAALPYGEWQLWLKDQQEILGFTIRTAQRLLKLAETTLTTHLSEHDAVSMSRSVWGNEPELVAAAPLAFSGHYRRVTGFVDWIEKHAVSDVPDAELIELRPRIERIRQWLDEMEGKTRRLNLRLTEVA